MLLIPAIDLKEGQCVRLRQGRMEDATVYSDDPVSIAKKWVDAGARRLHIVDLDGAFAGKPVNRGAIQRIVERFQHVPIQVGGGIRDDDTIQDYLDIGVSYVILGTKAVASPHFVADACVEFPGHVMVALDTRDGKLATDGWSKLSNHDVIDLAQQIERDGAEALIYTDVGRDGMLSGPNVDATVELARAVHLPVFAAGGINRLEDVEALAAVATEGVAGAITGRAIYEGTLDFAEGQRVADGSPSSAKG